MLSSVLKSDQAALVCITIMRILTKHRSFLLFEKVDGHESGVNKVFKVVFERLDSLEVKLPSQDKNRKKIGIKNKQ